MFWRWGKRLAVNQWFYLFHALIAMLILFPYLDPVHSDLHNIFIVLFLNTIVVALILYSVSPAIKHFLFGLLLGLPALLLFWLNKADSNHLVIYSSIFAMYLYAIWMTIRFLVFSKEFKVDQLFGGASVYLMIGLAWTILYLALELVTPGSFRAAADIGEGSSLTWSDFIYFSFTTLTTLGYGDITPINPIARSLAILEAITGVLFVPVIISGLVAVTLSVKLSEREGRKL